MHSKQKHYRCETETIKSNFDYDKVIDNKKGCSIFWSVSLGVRPPRLPSFPSPVQFHFSQSSFGSRAIRLSVTPCWILGNPRSRNFEVMKTDGVREPIVLK